MSWMSLTALGVTGGCASSFLWVLHAHRRMDQAHARMQQVFEKNQIDPLSKRGAHYANPQAFERALTQALNSASPMRITSLCINKALIPLLGRTEPLQSGLDWKLNLVGTQQQSEDWTLSYAVEEGTENLWNFEVHARPKEPGSDLSTGAFYQVWNVTAQTRRRAKVRAISLWTRE